MVLILINSVFCFVVCSLLSKLVDIFLSLLFLIISFHFHQSFGWLSDNGHHHHLLRIPLNIFAIHFYMDACKLEIVVYSEGNCVVTPVN